MVTPTQAIAEALGITRDIKDGEELTGMIRRGLPSACVRALSEHLQLDHAAAARVFGIAPRTLSRRLSQRARLTPVESDRAVRVARVFSQAAATLGDQAHAVAWLHTPNRALRGERPLDLLDTDPGAIAVEDVMGRIAYGGYS